MSIIDQLYYKKIFREAKIIDEIDTEKVLLSKQIFINL